MKEKSSWETYLKKVFLGTGSNTAKENSLVGIYNKLKFLAFTKNLLAFSTTYYDSKNLPTNCSDIHCLIFITSVWVLHHSWQKQVWGLVWIQSGCRSVSLSVASSCWGVSLLNSLTECGAHGICYLWSVFIPLTLWDKPNALLPWPSITMHIYLFQSEFFAHF